MSLDAAVSIALECGGLWCTTSAGVGKGATIGPLTLNDYSGITKKKS